MAKALPSTVEVGVWREGWVRLHLAAEVIQVRRKVTSGPVHF